MNRKMFAAAALAIAVTLTGCATAGPDAGGGGGDVDVAKYQEIAETAMAENTTWPGPEAGPAAATDVKAMVIVCGFAAEGCKGPADAAVEAGEAIGWDVTVVDGQFDPQVFTRSISQAIDQDYDVIILNAIAAEAVAEPIRAAREAGIIVGSWDSGNVPSETGVSFEVDEPVAEQGENLASYMIWKSGGAATASLFVAPEFPVVSGWMGGAQSTFEDCGTCEVAKNDQFTAGEADTRLPTLISSNLRQNPNINVVITGYDAALLSTIPTLSPEQAEQVLIGGFNGISPMLQFIRDGKADATSAVAIKWGMWAAFDNANRLLQGEDIVDQNIPTRLITVDNIDDFPADGQWDGDVDYRSSFQAIWSGK